MSAVEVSVFTAERDGHRLRAFGGPTLDDTWFALGDLAAALTTSRADEVDLLAGLGAGALDLRLRSAVTPDGPLVLVDHRSTYRFFAVLAAMYDGPAALPSATAIWEDAAVGVLVEGRRRGAAGGAPL